MQELNEKRVAIVYDRLNKWGGAERVLLALHEIFPKAALFTSVYDEKKAAWAKVFPKIYTSFLHELPFAKSNHELLGWLMPLAFESFNFKDYDIVITVTSEAAKGIITSPNTFHFSYILTPTRYLWSHYDFYFKNKILKIVSLPVVKYLRKWDKIAAHRPDKIIAISKTVQERVKKFYDLDSEVIFPPVDIQKMPDSKEDMHYFLLVSRLVPYKRVDLAVRVFNKIKKPLVIIGAGSQEKKLKKIAKSNITFVKLEFNEEEKLRNYFKNAHAFIMPQSEDFGITAIEAQSFGVPVIAFNDGGAKDTVTNLKTGVLFDEQNEASLTSAIAMFEKIRFNLRYLRENAEKFSKEKFKRQLRESLIRSYSSWRGRN